MQTIQSLSDRELVASFMQNAKDSAEELYRRYFTRLARFCGWRLNSEPDGEDAAQEVMLKVIAKRKLDGFRGESSLWTWLKKVASNECCDLIRRKRKSFPVVYLDAACGENNFYDVLPSSLSRPDELACRQEEQALLGKMVGRLCLPYQRTVYLSIYLEHSYRQGARKMGISVRAFAVYRHRALRYLSRLCRKQHLQAGSGAMPYFEGADGLDGQQHRESGER